MSRATPVQVARWALRAGFRTPNSQTAIAVSLAQGADPVAPAGAWGIGGPVGDGQAQASAAFAQWKTQGWDEFPAWSSGAWRLYLPTATTAQALANLDAVADQGVGVVTNPVKEAVTGVTAPFQGAANILDYMGTEEFWRRAMKITIGLLMVTGAAIQLAWTTGARPALNVIGLVDSKIQEQNIGEVTPVRIVK